MCFAIGFERNLKREPVSAPDNAHTAGDQRRSRCRKDGRRSECAEIAESCRRHGSINTENKGCAPPILIQRACETCFGVQTYNQGDQHMSIQQKCFRHLLSASKQTCKRGEAHLAPLQYGQLRLWTRGFVILMYFMSLAIVTQIKWATLLARFIRFRIFYVNERLLLVEDTVSYLWCWADTLRLDSLGGKEKKRAGPSFFYFSVFISRGINN